MRTYTDASGNTVITDDSLSEADQAQLHAALDATAEQIKALPPNRWHAFAVSVAISVAMNSADPPRALFHIMRSATATLAGLVGATVVEPGMKPE